MRTISLIALGGMLTLLSLPAAAQGRGPQPRAERGGPAQERPTQRPQARAELDQLRARLLERFDTDGDGRLSDAERAEARRKMKVHARGEGRPGDARRPGVRGDGAKPQRPGLERLREHARTLSPEQRELLRERLSERLRSRHQDAAPQGPDARRRPHGQGAPLRQRRGADAQGPRMQQRKGHELRHRRPQITPSPQQRGGAPEQRRRTRRA